MIATTAFQGLAVSELSALGVAGLPLLVIEHPLGGERPDAVARRSHQALEQLASLISGVGRGASHSVGAGGASTGRDVGGLNEKGGAPIGANTVSESELTLDDDALSILAELAKACDVVFAGSAD